MSKTKGLILGVDPSLSGIPNCYKNDTVAIKDWGLDIITACHPYIQGIKLQSAYFESYGLYGLTALSQLIKSAKEVSLDIIMDAKRGDIGSTSNAYATAYLANVNNGGNTDFESDYLTVNPLMGEDCIQPFVDMAVKYNKGLFVLLETSNPGASMILKNQLSNQMSVSENIATYIQREHQRLMISEGDFGPIGCVIGATNDNVSHWRDKLPNSVFLMPGIGAQGGNWDTVKSCLNENGEGVLVPISRGITQASNASISRTDYIQYVAEKANSYSDDMKRALNS